MLLQRIDAPTRGDMRCPKKELPMCSGFKQYVTAASFEAKSVGLYEAKTA